MDTCNRDSLCLFKIEKQQYLPQYFKLWFEGFVYHQKELE